MSSLGGLFGLEPPSQSKLNRKTIYIGSGSDIVSLTSTADPVLFFCDETGSSLTVDNFYFRTADGLSLKNIFRKHLHNSINDVDGGDYFDIDIANADKICIERTHGERTTLWAASEFIGTGSAAITDEVEANTSLYVDISSGTTDEGWAYLADGGLQFSFANRAELRAKLQFSHNGSEGQGGQIWRAGVAAEKPQNNSDTANRSFGIEGCSGLGQNIFLFNCDGGGLRPQTDTTTNMKTGTGGTNTSLGVKVFYTPSTNVVYSDTAAHTVVSNNNVPSNGSAFSDRMLRYGIRTSDAGTAKHMYLWADALYGKIDDPSWVGV